MKARHAAALAALLGWWGVAVGQVQELRYLGPAPGTANGRIELGAGVYDVAVGSQIPGWGQVASITPTHLVVRQRLTEAEQEHLRSQGMVTYDVLELHIPRGAPETR
jgi:hypothetical protein